MRVGNFDRKLYFTFLFKIRTIQHEPRCVYLFFFNSNARKKETEDEDCIPKTCRDQAMFMKATSHGRGRRHDNAWLSIWLCNPAKFKTPRIIVNWVFKCASPFRPASKSSVYGVATMRRAFFTNQEQLHGSCIPNATRDGPTSVAPQKLSNNITVKLQKVILNSIFESKLCFVKKQWWNVPWMTVQVWIAYDDRNFKLVRKKVVVRMQCCKKNMLWAWCWWDRSAAKSV